MKVSLIICTRNRAHQLTVMLEQLDMEEFFREDIELVLVDSASTDSTPDVISRFQNDKKISIKCVRVRAKGLGLARNEGIKAAAGDLLVFTDDDCYLGPNYFGQLRECFDAELYQYGMGEILLFDESDDNKIANKKIDIKRVIPPWNILPAGMIQGANLFFHRKVFQTAGLFNPDMGAGTPFPCEDIEMATRASLHGFTGVLLPTVRVYHHHGRKPGSPESTQVLAGYDTGRGAYYASLIHRGVGDTWKLWGSQTRANNPMPAAATERLSRELHGAADYLDHLIGKSNKN